MPLPARVEGAAIDAAAAERFENGARRRHACWIDMGFRPPQASPINGTRTLKVGGTNAHHDHAARQFAINSERRAKVRIGIDRGKAVDAERAVKARNQEEQRDAWVMHNVSERIDPVIATTIGQENGPFISHPDKPTTKITTW